MYDFDDFLNTYFLNDYGETLEEVKEVAQHFNKFVMLQAMRDAKKDEAFDGLRKYTFMERKEHTTFEVVRMLLTIQFISEGLKEYGGDDIDRQLDIYDEVFSSIKFVPAIYNSIALGVADTLDNEAINIIKEVCKKTGFDVKILPAKNEE